MYNRLTVTGVLSMLQSDTKKSGPLVLLCVTISKNVECFPR